MTKETGLVKQENKNELTVPQELMEDLGGLVNVGKSVVKTPRLKLTSANSDNAISGLSVVGEFACAAYNKNYGKKISIIPIAVNESASLLFSPKDPPANCNPEDYKDGDVVCASHDITGNKAPPRNIDGILCSNCPYGAHFDVWTGDGKVKKAPKCKRSVDVICVETSSPDKPMEINFRKTSWKTGIDIVRGMLNDPSHVYFGSEYLLESDTGKSEGGFKYQFIKREPQSKPLDQKTFDAVVSTASKIAKAKASGNLERESEEYTNDDLPI